jgi:hypothetical protein
MTHIRLGSVKLLSSRSRGVIAYRCGGVRARIPRRKTNGASPQDCMFGA